MPATANDGEISGNPQLVRSLEEMFSMRHSAVSFRVQGMLGTPLSSELELSFEVACPRLCSTLQGRCWGESMQTGCSTVLSRELRGWVSPGGGATVSGKSTRVMSIKPGGGAKLSGSKDLLS